MNDKVTEKRVVDDNDALEPEGPLGHDPIYAEAITDPSAERLIDKALGPWMRFRRRWLGVINWWFR